MIQPSNADARVCAALTRRHARTFAFASTFLPERKQRAAFALYTFCRRADDIVDRVAADRSLGLARRELVQYRQRLAVALAGEPDDAAFRELAWAAREFRVPGGVLRELLDGVGRDLTPTVYRTWDDVAAYAEGVASSVGEMLVYVFGTAAGSASFATAVRYARTLGTAMQLTNILRDVGEDARRGRCYLPSDDLAGFGLSRADVLEGRVSPGDTAWRRLLTFEIARARELYAQGAQGIALLSRDSRRCTTICASGYAAILGAIERNGYDSLRVRARVSRWEQARIVLGTWWTPLRGAALAPTASSYSATG